MVWYGAYKNDSDLRYSEVPLKGKNTSQNIGGSSTQDDPCRSNIGGSRPLQPLRRWRLWRRMITAQCSYNLMCRWYNQKLIRVMSPLSGGGGWTAEYRLETGSRHITFKRLLNLSLVLFKRLENYTLDASMSMDASVPKLRKYNPKLTIGNESVPKIIIYDTIKIYRLQSTFR